MTGSSTGTLPRYRNLTRICKTWWFQFHLCLLAILQRIWTAELLSTLARIQRSRALNIYELTVDDGGRNDESSNMLFLVEVVMQANVCE